MRFRGALVCLGVSVGVLVSGCNAQDADNGVPATTATLSTASTAAPSVTVTVPSRTDPPTTVPSSSSSPSSTPVPTSASSPEVPTSDAGVAGSSADLPVFDPRTLPDLPAPDRDTPGPEGGAVCASNADYSNETTDGLDPNTAAAYDAAKAGAAAEGVVMCLNDGKRSTAQQEATYQGYVDQYGTGAAQTYVLPPEKSEHVAGYAVDVQPAPAYQWLERTGGTFGLCRIYEVEPWHFEFSKAYAGGCTALLPGAVTSY